MASTVFIKLFIFAAFLLLTSSTAFIVPKSVVTGRPKPHHNNTGVLQKRAARAPVSTCGYHDGVVSKPLTANSGFDCRVDAPNGLWGFCPTTVIAASDCGLAGSCIDLRCSEGCVITDKKVLTTLTCNRFGQEFCSTALLIFGTDQTYSYLACGPDPTIEYYLAPPTALALQTSIASSSRTVSLPPPAATTQASPSPPETSKSAEAHHPTTATVPAGEPQSSEKGSSNLGAIIGGALGGLALLCASAVAIVYLLKKRHGTSVGETTQDGQMGHESVVSTQFQNKAGEGSRNLGIPSELAATPTTGPKHVELPG